MRIVMLYEDKSQSTYFLKLSKPYTLIIKKSTYVVIPECIVSGKYPTLYYYFNNPLPIKFAYERSKVSSKDLYDKHQFDKLPLSKQHTLATTFIDAKALNVAFSSNLINKMFDEGRITTKNVIIILVVIVIIILVFLQIFGVVDVMGMLSGSASKIAG